MLAQSVLFKSELAHTNAQRHCEKTMKNILELAATVSVAGGLVLAGAKRGGVLLMGLGFDSARSGAPETNPLHGGGLVGGGPRGEGALGHALAAIAVVALPIQYG